jgi:hypothetical protein
MEIGSESFVSDLKISENRVLCAVEDIWTNARGSNRSLKKIS